MSVASDLERIELQERVLRLSEFNTEAAWRLGSLLRSLAVERSHAIVIDVRRPGQPLFYCALEGTSPNNQEWIRRKSNTVARFHSSSYAVGMREKLKGRTQAESQGLALADYATQGGAFPLAVASAGLVGSVAVSGLRQRADHELVVEAMCLLLGKDYSELRLPPEDES